MSLSLAQRNAWSLAKSLMVCITLFRTGQSYGVMPSAEFDGDPNQVIHEYDPWEASPSAARTYAQVRFGGLASLRSCGLAFGYTVQGAPRWWWRCSGTLHV